MVLILTKISTETINSAIEIIEQQALELFEIYNHFPNIVHFNATMRRLCRESKLFCLTVLLIVSLNFGLVYAGDDNDHNGEILVTTPTTSATPIITTTTKFADQIKPRDTHNAANFMNLQQPNESHEFNPAEKVDPNQFELLLNSMYAMQSVRERNFFRLGQQHKQQNPAPKTFCTFGHLCDHQSSSPLPPLPPPLSPSNLDSTQYSSIHHFSPQQFLYRKFNFTTGIQFEDEFDCDLNLLQHCEASLLQKIEIIEAGEDGRDPLLSQGGAHRFDANQDVVTSSQADILDVCYSMDVEFTCLVNFAEKCEAKMTLPAFEILKYIITANNQTIMNCRQKEKDWIGFDFDVQPLDDGTDDAEEWTDSNGVFHYFHRHEYQHKRCIPQTEVFRCFYQNFGTEFDPYRDQIARFEHCESAVRFDRCVKMWLFSGAGGHTHPNMTLVKNGHHGHHHRYHQYENVNGTMMNDVEDDTLTTTTTPTTPIIPKYHHHHLEQGSTECTLEEKETSLEILRSMFRFASFASQHNSAGSGPSMSESELHICETLQTQWTRKGIQYTVIEKDVDTAHHLTAHYRRQYHMEYFISPQCLTEVEQDHELCFDRFETRVRQQWHPAGLDHACDPKGEIPLLCCAHAELTSCLSTFVLVRCGLDTFARYRDGVEHSRATTHPQCISSGEQFAYTYQSEQCQALLNPPLL